MRDKRYHVTRCEWWGLNKAVVYTAGTLLKFTFAPYVISSSTTIIPWWILTYLKRTCTFIHCCTNVQWKYSQLHTPCTRWHLSFLLAYGFCVLAVSRQTIPVLPKFHRLTFLLLYGFFIRQKNGFNTEHYTWSLLQRNSPIVSEQWEFSPFISGLKCSILSRVALPNFGGFIIAFVSMTEVKTWFLVGKR